MSNASRARRTMVVFSLAIIVVVLAAVVLTSGVAEAQRGGGGRGGGGGGKPSGVSKPLNADQSPSAKSGEKGASSGLYSPGYGVRHGSLSNFFL